MQLFCKFQRLYKYTDVIALSLSGTYVVMRKNKSDVVGNITFENKCVTK